MHSSDPLHVRDAPGAAGDDSALVEELRALLAEADGVEELARRMALLADPRRLRILFCLHAHPGVRSSDVARALDAHDSTTSHALAMLREAGWVRSRREGREVRYELADATIHALLHDLGSGHLPGVRHTDDRPEHSPEGDPLPPR
ncbi:ArsR/SmtB family transcription factor [Brachybacterium saurashtrense]|uniref:Transcriptional regulator n=1 Tax=Brachybacterium saurashtrense TaxID=556288 RepID=A0A345YSV1_9MICO|nr:metalloregulator ArsR/SmtB family transcription factor [Brachybacterium saurashtrense]AXK47003.1 transcriptional regulator [Brachybacterium saurashtrense]RRR22718.1 transcriptional regulator [Brachybacterium saurashtrense]